MKIGQTVKFSQGDEANTQLIGTIARIRCNGQMITIQVEGTIAGTVKTYVRYADRVQVV